jgi:hypothetical protein
LHLVAKAKGGVVGLLHCRHAAKGIAGKFYRFHELPDEFGDIVTAIKSFKDPAIKAAARPTMTL